MSRELFSIEHGTFALALTNPAVPLPGVVPTDYTFGGAADSFQCQITNAALTASPNSSSEDVPATMCSPGESREVVQATSYTLDLGYLQDPNVADGLSAFLFEHDAELAYFYFGTGGADGSEAPRAIGKLRLQSGAIGGEMRTTLSADVSLPVEGKPDIEFGSGATTRIVLGDDVAGGGTPAPTPPTGATAGTPGAWTPAGSQIPADLAAANALGLSLGAAWATTGDYVEDASANHIYWDGSAFISGDVP